MDDAYINKKNNTNTLNILVAGLARNCGKTIAKDVNRISVALTKFKSVEWLIIESDSNDNTISVLDILSKNTPFFRYISLGKLREKIPSRTERIAYCRNKYLDELKKNSRYENIDFVLIADLDGINSHVNEASISSCWEHNNWDVCTANQTGPYYDVWALRHPAWSPNDCWEQYEFLIKHKVSRSKALNNAVYSRMIFIERNAPWIEVESAFGGLAIYKKMTLVTSQYIGVRNDGKEICEHVELHRQINEKGYKIFINPNLINSNYTEHSNNTKCIPQLKNRLKDLVRIIKHYPKMRTRR